MYRTLVLLSLPNLGSISQTLSQDFAPVHFVDFLCLIVKAVDKSLLTAFVFYNSED